MDHGTSEGRVFLAEQTAGAKALRWEYQVFKKIQARLVQAVNGGVTGDELREEGAEDCQGPPTGAPGTCFLQIWRMTVSQILLFIGSQTPLCPYPAPPYKVGPLTGSVRSLGARQGPGWQGEAGPELLPPFEVPGDSEGGRRPREEARPPPLGSAALRGLGSPDLIGW